MNATIEPEVQAKWELSITANRLHFDNNVPSQKL